MACTYNVDNFVNVPVPGQKLDSAIRIYNAAGQHTFSIEPYISYFTQGGNYVYIITQNNMKYQYSLDFCSETEANDALTKLNRVKKIYMDSNVPEEYYSKDHIDTTYYTRVQMGQLYFDKNYINANFLNKSGGTLNGNLTVIGNAKLSGLTLESGVTVYNISTDNTFGTVDNNTIATTRAIKEYFLNHSGGTVDLSNYYTKSQTDANFLSANTSFYSRSEVYNTGETYSKIEVDSNFLSANTSFYSKSEVYNTGETYSKIEVDSNFLSANTSFYTQSQANANFLSANTSFYTQSQANSNFLSANTSLNFVSKTGDTINGSLNIINNLNISGYTLLNTLKLQSGVTIYNISSDSGLTNYDDNTIQTTKSIKDYVDTKNKVNDAIQLSGDGIYTINLTESKFIRYITNSGLSLSVTGNTTDGNAGSVWFEVYNSGTTTITPVYNGIMDTNSYWLSIKPTSILTGETYIYSVTTYNISNNIFYRISGTKLGI